ncbi:hypothetical protein [Methylomonas koyamae]|uniref:hypothetical protein n=1 Tax=Methylomonas koyamae TaxID=702114 RepID=UPI00112B8AA4|nr:hypothetical protein [Methylomonas koyamae]TPQ24437.1 hypothetical protein C2U68_19765 [Methylomonas koyamae]
MIRQHLDLIAVAGVGAGLAMYDLTIDLVFSVAHFLFEMLHLAFEWFELGIEHAVEHTFHTTRHGSQIITFYILLALGGSALYALWKALPLIRRRLQQALMNAWVRRKTECELYWQSLTLQNKLRLLSTLLGAVYLSTFFVM